MNSYAVQLILLATGAILLFLEKPSDAADMFLASVLVSAMRSVVNESKR
jgi:hypothetical protein